MRLYGFLEMLREQRLSEFNKELLNEGLINSINYDKAIQKISDLIKKYNLEGNCFLYEGKDRIELDINDDNIYHKKDFYSEFMQLLNLLGYYIANYKLNKNDEEFVNGEISFEFFIKNKPILFLNKKYDIVIYNKKLGKADTNMPEYLFHVTLPKHLDKIEKSGLVAKSKRQIQNHPERIYLFSGVDGCYDYIEYKKMNDYIILKINVKSLYNLKLYEDPKYTPDVEAFYTYDNIPPFSLKIIETKNNENI
jgi:hypothetical protein